MNRRGDAPEPTGKEGVLECERGDCEKAEGEISSGRGIPSSIWDILPVHGKDKERYDFILSRGHDPMASRLRFALEIRKRLVLKAGLDNAQPCEECDTVSIECGPFNILDIGTGRGYFSLILASKMPNSHITTMDISQEQLGIAREKVCKAAMEDRVTLLPGDAAVYHFPPGTFDAAVAYVSMHHMENADAVLSQMRRAAGADGLVAIADYTREGLRMLAEARERFGHGGGHGHREIPAEELEMTMGDILMVNERDMECIPGRHINYYFF